MAFKDIIFVGKRTVSQSPTGDGDVILSVEQDGTLRWHCYFGSGKDDVSGSFGWHSNSGHRIGNGWQKFLHLVGVYDGVILGVEREGGNLLWFRYIGNGEEDVSGSTGWHPNSGNRIGNNWHGFKNIFVYPLHTPTEIGVQIFGVEQNGDLRWYGYTGNGVDDVSGNTGFHPNSRNFIGRGWHGFRHLVSGGGVTFGVDQNGDLHWYRYDGRGKSDNSGATGWLPNSGNPIGKGWHGFRHLFVGAQPSGLGGWNIYGVEQDGNLRWYNYFGHGESNVNGTTGYHRNSRNFIGRGW